ncbi:hypothetical protein BABINDRAFT_163224 [Babjeviella inositovora NRRL Y-12698]|uniref:Serine/threonine-protein phosphatase 2A activator n=1 Tax=Babjeviella inositovora NRRL Y-12698 TaxID=984486 RepID=A0A1E3QJP0_9ASCO|nr:uncharacterized protein BABINDRAFT_163224 [Babjeviella inositovora NRRL Y-12698]ODQ77838.1 hypothetical protein BABINDRAFT_163224 [Babjeviella inositovora NRRL Y-12698]
MSEPISFVIPVKRILTPEDLTKWGESETYKKLNAFIERLATSIKGLTNEAETGASEIIDALLAMLDGIETILSQHPVVEDANTSRFGKVEFRDFYDDVKEQVVGLLAPIVQIYQKTAYGDPTVELAAYLSESFGNRTRIDYGSGHELNFMALLLCLDELRLFVPEDDKALVLKVFIRYMALMRRLQREYWLEPAGSHGVWGLDDYHFLPFLFGSWQLYTHPNLRPKSIRSQDMVDMFHPKYMYFECINFINEVKNVPLRWHSPMLDDISGVKTWAKVAEGMFKMFKAEVLGKLPVMQHFLFGSILVVPVGISEKGDQDDDCCGHSLLNTWGDCCGIKVPSAIGASQMNKQQGIKPIPFD